MDKKDLPDTPPTQAVPDLQTELQWCGKCKADVLPRGKGLCPRCGRMLRQNFLARKGPVNVLRRQQLLDKLLADYDPQTTLQRANCENLAGALEQLESLRPGSPEWQRLTEKAQQLGAVLDASKPATPQSDLDTASTDELIARLSTALHTLLDAQQGTPPEPTPDRAPPAQTSEGAPLVACTEPVPAVVPTCPYCLRACVGPEHPSYAVLHWRDPEQVKQRDAQATKEMYEAIRRQRFGDPWLH